MARAPSVQRLARAVSTSGRLALLLLAGLLSVASPDWPEPENEERVDETWLVQNLWDGQTAVDPHIAVVLTLGERDFAVSRNAHTALPMLELRHAATDTPVSFTLDIGWEQTVLTPDAPLSPYTDFVLDLSPLRGAVRSMRGWPPAPIRFSTCAAPRLVGVWLNEGTVILVFSEDMDPDTLFLSQRSVDVRWVEDGQLRSLATDRNLADFVWDADGPLFRFAPFTELEELFEAWVTVSTEVESARGVPLDADGDCDPGTVTDDVVLPVDPWLLQTCYARSDIPDPCMAEGWIPTFEIGWW